MSIFWFSGSCTRSCYAQKEQNEENPQIVKKVFFYLLLIKVNKDFGKIELQSFKLNFMSYVYIYI